jgi:hypothetical protein
VTWAALSGLVVLTKQLNSGFRTTLSSICNAPNALESVERKAETLLGEDTPHTIQRAEGVKAALSSSEADIAEMQAHQDTIKKQSSATQHKRSPNATGRGIVTRLRCIPPGDKMTTCSVIGTRHPLTVCEDPHRDFELRWCTPIPG